MGFEAHLERLANRYRSGIPIRIRLWNGREIDLADQVNVTVTLRQPESLRYLLRPTLSSLGEGFVEGALGIEGPVWEIVRVAEELSRAQAATPSRWAAWRRPRHSRHSDAKAIAYHYDLSNDFYQLWLDRQMVYSCAYFKSPQDDLDLAQEQKLDHTCRKLMLKPGESFLDIGCGWGALVCWAAKHYGVRATGITLSQRQYDYARARVEAEGLGNRVTIRHADYRDLQDHGLYDKIASIGMVEHVGHKNLPIYFQQIHRLLQEGGLLLNHGITTSEVNDGAAALGGADFISRYVFPEGETPTLSRILAEMGLQGLEVADVESLRPHYAQTLWHWVERLEARRAEAEALIGAKRTRIWYVYLAGCAHAFERGWVSIYQVLAAKQASGLSPLPWTRDHLYVSGAETTPARICNRAS